MQISSVSTSAVLQALGKTNILFFLGFMNTIISLIGLVVAVTFFKTIDGLAYMAICSSTWAALSSLIVLYKFVFKKGLRIFFSYVFRPILFFLTMIGVSYLTDVFFIENVFVSLILKIFIFCIFFFLFLTYFTPYSPQNYIQLAISRFRRS